MRESGKEEEREREQEPNDLGFPRHRRGVGFDPAEDGARPSDQNQRPRILGPSLAQAGVSERGALLAQAQVAAYAREDSWAEPVFSAFWAALG